MERPSATIATLTAWHLSTVIPPSLLRSARLRRTSVSLRGGYLLRRRVPPMTTEPSMLHRTRKACLVRGTMSYHTG